MALTPEQNRDEIIAMALVAGMSANIGYTEASGEHFPAVAALKTSVPVQWLERFAALVAAREREACAVWRSKEGRLLDEDDVPDAMRARKG